MRILLSFLVILLSSNAFAGNIQFSEEQFIDLLVQVRCIQKTNEGISQNELVEKVSEIAKSQNIQNFNWNDYLVAHKHYTSQNEFIDNHLIKIGARIGECVQSKVADNVASDGFYGAPIYSGSRVVDKVDHSSVSIASLTLNTSDSAKTAYNFYIKSLSKYNPKESQNNGRDQLEYSQNEKQRIIQFEETPFGTDITIMIEK